MPPPMREDTRRRLERAIWMRRLKIASGVLGLLAFMGLGFWYTGLDASQTTRKVPGVVTAVGPFNGTSSIMVEQGLAVDVKLDDGRSAHVLALKTTDPKVGDHVEIAEHTHGTGRVTFTWK